MLCQVCGAANAPVVIQEISDYQCPFCARVLPTIERLLEAYPGRVRLVWRDLPLPFHPNAHIAAQAAREVFRQGGNDKFWAYNAKLFENQRDLTRETLERLAQELGGINMAQFRQALDTERHKAAVDADLAAAQAAVEKIDVGGNFLEDRIERLVEQFKPRQFGVAQFHDHAHALGAFDACGAHGLLQPLRRLRRRRGSRTGIPFFTPHVIILMASCLRCKGGL